MRTAGAVLALLALAGPAAAGPWPAGRGHYYAKLGGGWLRSDTLVAPDGTEFDIPRFTRREVSVYAALGLNDRLTGIVSVPFVRSAHLQGFGSETGIGDVQAGLQAQLGRKGPWVFAARGVAQAPTGDETRADGLLPTGSGAWEAEVGLSGGRSLAGGRGYGFFEAGHQLRGSALRDAFSYSAQAGWNASRRVVLALGARGVEPYDSSARVEAIGSPVGLSDRVTYLVWGPTIIVSVGRGIGLQADLERAARAKNLARGTAVRFGVSVAR